MAVTWLTLDSTAERNVRWGLSPSSLYQTATADSRTYTQGGWLGAIHSAVMTNLTRGAQIFYQVGGDWSGWSGLASFAAPSTTLQPGFGFLMTGDMGAELNYSAANQAWINFASAGKNPDIAIHTVIHIGGEKNEQAELAAWRVAKPFCRPLIRPASNLHSLFVQISAMLMAMKSVGMSCSLRWSRLLRACRI